MTTTDQRFEGVYGPYVINEMDRREVQNYRFALLLSGLTLLSGVLNWWLIGARSGPIGARLGLD